jgi:hypothetical protein
MSGLDYATSSASDARRDQVRSTATHACRTPSETVTVIAYVNPTGTQIPVVRSGRDLAIAHAEVPAPAHTPLTATPAQNTHTGTPSETAHATNAGTPIFAATSTPVNATANATSAQAQDTEIVLGAQVTRPWSTTIVSATTIGQDTVVMNGQERATATAKDAPVQVMTSATNVLSTLTVMDLDLACVTKDG